MDFTTGSFKGVAATAFVWTLIWAAPGMAIEVVDNMAPAAHSFTRAVDMWPQTLGLPGLVAGVLFGILILITDRRRRLAELQLPRSVGWGAVSGLVVASIIVWVMDTGLSEPWQLGATLAAVGTLLGALSGVGTPLVFTYLARRRASARS